MRNRGVGSDAALRPDAGVDLGATDDAGGIRGQISGDGRSALRGGLARLAGVVRPAGRALAPDGTLSGGGQRASGAGSADGGAFGASGGVDHDGGPRFDEPVVPGGYAWWYLDALSDDGQHGLAIIIFLGSVFSPYYAWSGRRDPLNHCAVNVALYGECEALGDDRARPGRRPVARAMSSPSGASALGLGRRRARHVRERDLRAVAAPPARPRAARKRGAQRPDVRSASRRWPRLAADRAARTADRRDGGTKVVVARARLFRRQSRRRTAGTGLSLLDLVAGAPSRRSARVL